MNTKRVAILLADGFEEIEALTPKDVLTRAGYECDLISIKSDLLVKGAMGVTVKVNRNIKECGNFSDYAMLVLPGGMPGAKYLSESEDVITIIKNFNSENKYIAAICASPALVLSKAEVANDKCMTCYPGMESNFKSSRFEDKVVVQDGNIITSRGPATALEFSYKLVEVLGKNPEPLKDGMLYNYLIENYRKID